jgi:hypothetical protein
VTAMTEGFTSIVDCPKCGDIGVHFLDEPMPAPTSDDREQYARDLCAHMADPGDQIMSWGGEVVRLIGGTPPPRPPVDESIFEVMRVCKECGHRWGIHKCHSNVSTS